MLQPFFRARLGNDQLFNRHFHVLQPFFGARLGNRQPFDRVLEVLHIDRSSQSDALFVQHLGENGNLVFGERTFQFAFRIAQHRSPPFGQYSTFWLILNGFARCNAPGRCGNGIGREARFIAQVAL